jgi:hypothetical protein
MGDFVTFFKKCNILLCLFGPYVPCDNSFLTFSHTFFSYFFQTERARLKIRYSDMKLHCARFKHSPIWLVLPFEQLSSSTSAYKPPSSTSHGVVFLNSNVFRFCNFTSILLFWFCFCCSSWHNAYFLFDKMLQPTFYGRTNWTLSIVKN